MVLPYFDFGHLSDTPMAIAHLLAEIVLLLLDCDFLCFIYSMFCDQFLIGQLFCLSGFGNRTKLQFVPFSQQILVKYCYYIKQRSEENTTR